MYYDSYHKIYSGKEITWFGYDSDSLYEQHLKVKYEELAANKWIDYEPFTYKFNQHGFRCDEFTDTPNILFLGCSFAFGLGLPVEQTWPQIVASYLGLACYNLGQCGGSGDSSFRLGSHWIPVLSPLVVVYSVPPPDRLEIVLDHEFKRFLPNEDQSSRYEFYKHWVSNGENSAMNSLKNLYALRETCKGTKFVSIDILNRPDAFVDLARDLAHSGRQSNINLANFVLSQL